MSGLTYTLLGDGPSDQLLLYPMRWLLQAMGVAVEQAHWADFSFERVKPSGLVARAKLALERYPAELLIVHRDAENVPWEERVREIHDAIAYTHVAVVPVRMTEAWLLHDEAAIRRASGNPGGQARLELPPPNRVEAIADPKQSPAELAAMRARTAELIGTFEPLRAAQAFRRFMEDLRAKLTELGHLVHAS